MDESKTDLMVLSFEANQNILAVKWSNALSVESPEFYKTIVSLFATIQQHNVSKLLIDSGIPAGGVLTEEVIDHFIQHIPHTPLQHIALLESPDYLWDNNLYQVIKMLIAHYQLPIEIRLIKSRAACLEWLLRPSLPQSMESNVA